MKKLFRALTAALCMVACLTCLFVTPGCAVPTAAYKKNASLDTSKEVLLRFASSKETWPEMDSVIAKFEEIYPNCTIVCEYIEEYSVNLNVRLAQSEQKIDIFRTVNIQEGTEYRDKALNLISDEAKEILDLSHANPGLVANFKYTGAKNTQYAVPFGG